jgi:hypothetical protein
MLTVNSFDRLASSASSTNFSVSLPPSFSGSAPFVSAIELLEIQLPNTLYKIRAGINDKIDFNDGSVKVVTVTPGAYTSATLCSQLTTQLNAVSSNFTVTFNPNTLLITIANSSNFSLLFSSGANAATSTASILGYNGVDLTGTNTYTAQNVLKLYDPFSLFLNIAEIGITNFTTSKNNIPYTFRIPLNVTSGGVVQFDKQSFYSQPLFFSSPIKFSSLTCTLCYRDGTSVNLNGSNFEFVLKLYT